MDLGAFVFWFFTRTLDCQVNDEADRLLFPNTHDPIVDERTFEIVQNIRKNRRRPTKMGEQPMFSGLVYCYDCGNAEYLFRGTTIDPSQFTYNCGTYRGKQRHKCTPHGIRVSIPSFVTAFVLLYSNFLGQNTQMFMHIMSIYAFIRLYLHFFDNAKSEEKFKKFPFVIKTILETARVFSMFLIVLGRDRTILLELPPSTLEGVVATIAVDSALSAWKNFSKSRNTEDTPNNISVIDESEQDIESEHKKT